MAIQPALFGNVDPNQQVASLDEIKRRRAMSERLLAEGASVEPLQHPLQVVAKILQSGAGYMGQMRANKEDAAGRSRRNDAIGKMLTSMGGGGSSMPSAFTPASAAPMASSPAGGAMAASTGPSASAPSNVREGIAATASSLGINPVDLATAISYETAGTFDPTKRGPTTQWGQHRGLIQFGEPQAKKYGVNWNDPIGSQLGPNGAVANYLRDTGVKPGMGLLDIYSAINAGGVGRYNRSDANNGGAPGTVADKVNKQMAGHRQKAEALFRNSAQPVQVASLDPSAGMSIDAPDQLSPEDQQRLAALRTPQNTANVRPYSGPGASIDMEPPPQMGPRMPLDMKLNAQREQLGINAIPLPQPSAQTVMAPQAQPQGAQQAMAAALMGNAPLQEPMQATAVNTPMGMPSAPQMQQPAPPQQAMAQALTGGQMPQGPSGGVDRALIAQLLGDPYTEDLGQQLLMQTLEQQQQANDPMRQLELQKAQLEIEALRNPQVKPIEVNGRLLNPQTGQVIADFSDPDTSVVEGRVVNTRTGQVIYEAPPEAPEQFTLSPGQQRFDGNGNPIASGQAQPTFRPATPEELSTFGATGGQIGPDGRFYPVQPPTGTSIESDGQGGFRVVSGPGAGGMKPLTEGQSKDAVYATRAEGALATLDEYASTLTSRTDAALGMVPMGFGRDYQDKNFQLAQQAGDEFLQAILRKDTGAAITIPEQSLYGDTYLPRPGDSPELLQQKAVSRRRALEAIKAGMPPSAIIQQELALQRTEQAAPAIQAGPPGSAENPLQLDEVVVPAGVDPEDWKYMSEEDKALFR